MEHKAIQFIAPLNVDEAQGIVEHVVAVMGHVDADEDRIWPGAFTKSITERGTAVRVRVLDQHGTDSVMRVLGKPLSIREVGRNELPAELQTQFPDATGALLATTQFFLDTPEGKGAFIRIVRGGVPESSIGYQALDFDYTKELIAGKETTIRNIRTVRLWEYSPVIWGSQEATMPVSAKEKNMDTEKAKEKEAAVDFNTAYGQAQAERDLYETRWQIDSALWKSLYSCMEDEMMTPDQKRLMIGQSLDQFKAAMMAWCDQAMAVEQSEMAGMMAQMSAALDLQHKAGAVLSAANAGKIQGCLDDMASAMTRLKEVMQSAGMMDQQGDNGKSAILQPKDALDSQQQSNSEAGPEAKTTPPSDGPGAVQPPTFERMKLLVECELAENEVARNGNDSYENLAGLSRRVGSAL